MSRVKGTSSMKMIALLFVFLAAAAHAATDYATFVSMSKFEGNGTADYFAQPDPKTPATVRVYSESEYFISRDDRFRVRIEDMPTLEILILADTFKGRDMETCLRSDTNHIFYATLVFDKSKSWRNLDYERCFTLKYVMSVSAYARHAAARDVGQLRPRLARLEGDDRTKYRKIIDLYAQAKRDSFVTSAIQKSFASAIDVKALKTVAPETFDGILSALTETAAQIAASKSEGNPAIEWERGARNKAYSTHRPSTDTADFLDKLNWINHRGWTNEKRNRAYAELLEGRFYRK